MARWYPEASGGPFAKVPAIAEEGKAPQIPAPLIRVPVGTTIVATVRNTLTDSTVYVRGFSTHPAATLDSIPILPGESRTIRFAAGAPGTYPYLMTPGIRDPDKSDEREASGGALIVDAAGSHPADRIFVINIWGETRDSVTYGNALAINGKSWPFTERIAATVGDTLRWRIVNVSGRNHPMHLHGFYFRLAARGTPLSDTVYSPGQRRLAVTEDLSAGDTMDMDWIPNRPGNWLFHCHIAFHVVPGLAQLSGTPPDARHLHSVDIRQHMAGLVLGINVRARPGAKMAARPHPRKLHLFVDEGRRRSFAPRAMGFVLQRDAGIPARDSIEAIGSLIVLNRDEPTDITVVNRLPEATSIHWHGIELESYSDGVAGWSGSADHLAPVIAAQDSFIARLTLPRAGTFIYHTHLNDIEQADVATLRRVGGAPARTEVRLGDRSRLRSRMGWPHRAPTAMAYQRGYRRATDRDCRARASEISVRGHRARGTCCIQHRARFFGRLMAPAGEGRSGFIGPRFRFPGRR